MQGTTCTAVQGRPAWTRAQGVPSHVCAPRDARLWAACCHFHQLLKGVCDFLKGEEARTVESVRGAGPALGRHGSADPLERGFSPSHLWKQQHVPVSHCPQGGTTESQIPGSPAVWGPGGGLAGFAHLPGPTASERQVESSNGPCLLPAEPHRQEATVVLAGAGLRRFLDPGSQQGNGAQQSAGPSGTFWKLQACEGPLSARRSVVPESLGSESPGSGLRAEGQGLPRHPRQDRGLTFR